MQFLARLKWRISTFLRPYGKLAFIASIPNRARVLDVGCGNNSPFVTKRFRPDLHYTGIDIGLHNQSTDANAFADELILCSPEDFPIRIDEKQSSFDAIICAHNLEHCNDYRAVTQAMIQALRPHGKIYLSFPCAQSTSFPSRRGCLNFYDDGTHRNLIAYDAFIALLTNSGMRIEFATARYRPIIPLCIGLFCEPLCRLLNRPAPAGGSWALYGFETIIHAIKPK